MRYVRKIYMVDLLRLEERGEDKREEDGAKESKRIKEKKMGKME